MNDEERMNQLDTLLSDDYSSSLEELEEGIRVAESLSDADFRSWYLSRLARKLAPTNQRRALEIVRSVTGAYDKLGAMLAIAKRFSEAGQVEKAVSLVKEVRRIGDEEDPEFMPWQRADALNQCAKILRETGHHEDAMEAWERAVQIAQKGQGFDTDCSSVLAEIAIDLARSENLELAGQVAESISSVGRRRYALERVSEIAQGGESGS